MSQNTQNTRIKAVLTTSQLAELLQLSGRTLEKMRLEHRGPSYIKLGTGKAAQIRYALADVVAWLDQCRIEVDIDHGLGPYGETLTLNQGLLLLEASCRSAPVKNRKVFLEIK